MSSQINFFMMPEDVAELEDYIKKQGLIIVSAISPTPEPLILDTLFPAKGLKTLILLPDKINELKIRFVETQNYYYLNEMQSPVIEFRKPIYLKDENAIRSGRLYFDKNYLTEDGHLLVKDADIILLAEKLFKWFRKNFKNTKINYDWTTQRAAEWAKQNNGILK